jgi:hypothetical protein
MVNISTVTAITQGYQGAPGYSLFRFSELDTGAKLNAAGAAVRAFILAWASYWTGPTGGWSGIVQPIVQHHDVATGDLQGESTMGTPPTTVGGSGGTTATYAGGSGAVLHWTTGATHNGRKIRGRTFLVPCLSGAFSVDGTVTSAFITAITNAGNALIADSSTEFGIYSRYWDKKPGEAPAGVAPKQVGGSFTPATGCVVPDRSAQLRTRRN